MKDYDCFRIVWLVSRREFGQEIVSFLLLMTIFLDLIWLSLLQSQSCSQIGYRSTMFLSNERLYANSQKRDSRHSVKKKSTFLLCCSTMSLNMSCELIAYS